MNDGMPKGPIKECAVVWLLCAKRRPSSVVVRLEKNSLPIVAPRGGEAGRG